MAATIKDVAKAAGVSISTVSYALSGKRPIGEKTRRSIEAAIAELGYTPNAGARALAGRRTYILAVTEPLRPDTYEPAHMAFILATARAARQFDYDILLLTQEEAVEGLERVANSRIVDGIIVLDVLNDDERADLVRKLRVPADRKSTRLNSSHVATSYAVFCLKKKSPTTGEYNHDPQFHLSSGPLGSITRAARMTYAYARNCAPTCRASALLQPYDTLVAEPID